MILGLVIIVWTNTTNKSKIRQVELHQIKKRLYIKGNKGEKRKPGKWEKLSVNHIFKK